MALVPVFHGYVTEEAKLVLEPTEHNLRQGHLKRLAGKPVDVIVRQHRNKRSERQSRWHWGVAIPVIAQELGYDKHEHEQLHYALVAKCFGTVFDERLKQEVPKARSSQLTTAQFSEFMEWVVRYAATEWGIQIPMPGESEAAA